MRNLCLRFWGLVYNQDFKTETFLVVNALAEGMENCADHLVPSIIKGAVREYLKLEIDDLGNKFVIGLSIYSLLRLARDQFLFWTNQFVTF
jgi:hypothetical protein